MKNIKKVVAMVVSVCVIGVAGMVYAAEIKTPADIAASLTGKSVTDINKERTEGKTYGTIANEAGKLEDFKAQMLEQRKALLDHKVKDGQITQQQADDIYNAIKNNQATCDGTGNAQLGKRNGMGCGNGQGVGRGRGQCMMGRGCGLGNNGGNCSGVEAGCN